MYNLIVKDMLIQKKQMIFSLAYMAFVLVAFQGMGSSMFSAGLMAFTYMLAMTSCAYEDKNKSDVMLNSLPVKRSRIVAAKYLSVIVYLAMGTIIYMVSTSIIIMAQIPLKVYPLSLEIFIGVLISVGLMTGIWFPIFFKYGYMKLRVVNFVVFFLFFFGISFISDYLRKNQDAAWLQSMVNFFSSRSDAAIAAIFIASISIFLLISFMLSVWFYKNREF
ncbi:ABC-2 transporter permease [Lutispora sp.]|uniref:ABC-2 transporter permease n=1 Tax=Lutispora sp. TaxID=2828727 RepID=UPI002B20EE54|nr:ABC-2 transporter permease [Lutispora sp.]MEA4963723.1 ABC-2 transporter permease [Lutispora sp.]